ncbi:hypothetical protein UFOVP10_36 [uncultured Caudovirales phage]|uniref:Uncharacterized protein n=1 Tax=uncultured Caudovirales phage TaxID=2100421 RepID=A0A6J5KGM8_9CAUD|nr:hypothetical protein UFOVP10_36 [uncultured Caudovirales phage]
MRARCATRAPARRCARPYGAPPCARLCAIHAPSIYSVTPCAGQTMRPLLITRPLRARPHGAPPMHRCAIVCPPVPAWCAHCARRCVRHPPDAPATRATRARRCADACPSCPMQADACADAGKCLFNGQFAYFLCNRVPDCAHFAPFPNFSCHFETKSATNGRRAGAGSISYTYKVSRGVESTPNAIFATIPVR